MPGVNPYREAFYSRQAEWHGYAGAEDVRRRHEVRVPYYRWYTKGWLDLPRSTRILDIGRELGLDCRCVPVLDFLRDEAGEFGAVAMLDILEHFTREELFAILEAVAARMTPG